MKGLFTFLLCLIPPYAVALSGVFFRPGPWYEGLLKPFFTPPGWVFPVVWNILYFLMGVSLFLLWKKGLLNKRAGFLYFGQLILNGLWSPLFFGAHEVLAGLIVLTLMILLLTSFMVSIRQDVKLLLCNGPYLVWLLLAWALNFEIWRLNEI